MGIAPDLSKNYYLNTYEVYPRLKEMSKLLDHGRPMKITKRK
jgi:hypothetical protein